MRTFGFLLSKNSGFSEPWIPGARLARIQQSLKRRLDDDIEEVFHRACTANDLEAATDLLTVLEKWHERRSASYGRERRISGAALLRTRRELDRLMSLRATRAAPAATS